MIEVRREGDGELCGFVAEVAEAAAGDTARAWRATTVFGALLGLHDTHDGAVAHVLDTGLASLAQRWNLRRRGDDEAEVVCILEADPGGVTVALGYYSMPGVPTLRVTRAQLDAGDWHLTP